MVACDLLEGMPLLDALQIIQIEEPEVIVSVGSLSGFAAIEPIGELVRNINRISGERLTDLQMRKKEAFDQIICIVNREHSWKHTISNERIILAMVTAENKLRSFIPYASRIVRRCYRQMSGGLAVIVDGDEVGAYWYQKEYEKHHPGNRTAAGVFLLQQDQEPAKASLHSRDRE